MQLGYLQDRTQLAYNIHYEILNQHISVIYFKHIILDKEKKIHVYKTTHTFLDLKN